MVYSPRPPCGTGYPSCGVVVFQLCVRAREEGEPVAPPLPVAQDGFPFCHTHTHIRTHTHTHTMSLCGMAILSPNPPFVEQDGFPFATHTHHVFVNVWPFYLPTPLLWNRMVFPFALRHIHTHTHQFYSALPRYCGNYASPRVHRGRAKRGTIRVRHACSGSPPGLEASGPCIWGGYHWGGGGEGGGGAENAQRTTIYTSENTV